MPVIKRFQVFFDEVAASAQKQDAAAHWPIGRYSATKPAHRPTVIHREGINHGIGRDAAGD
jgi:hypothetical protein